MELTKVSQTPSEAQPTDNRHDGGHNHEQVTGDRNTGKERPGPENVSIDGAGEHCGPNGEDKCVEHSKEDESPFNLPKDRPPALSSGVSETHMEVGKDRTDAIHGTMIWNALVSLMNLIVPGTRVPTTARTMNVA